MALARICTLFGVNVCFRGGGRDRSYPPCHYIVGNRPRNLIRIKSVCTVPGQGHWHRLLGVWKKRSHIPREHPQKEAPPGHPDVLAGTTGPMGTDRSPPPRRAVAH